MNIRELVSNDIRLQDCMAELWRTQYLTSLRGKNQLHVGKQRGSSYIPEKDAVVLISDPIQPRHCCKMGEIQDFVDHNGFIREASISLPSLRIIRRPVNQLIPLELEEPCSEENEKPALTTTKSLRTI
ncbi:hypothetical protein GCK32_022691 [Trichostrongylus colubriformis]|uniref:DUF5641 domain-containing protein n=1 Tax=Trichostrongylus colubriformis TaxID=6319 RepID=A0AAN8FQB4_TRICO